MLRISEDIFTSLAGCPAELSANRAMISSSYALMSFCAFAQCDSICEVILFRDASKLAVVGDEGNQSSLLAFEFCI